MIEFGLKPFPKIAGVYIVCSSVIASDASWGNEDLTERITKIVSRRAWNSRPKAVDFHIDAGFFFAGEES